MEPVVSIVGQVTQVEVIGPGNEQAPPPPETARVHQGVVRYGAHSGQVEQQGVVSASMADVKGICGDGILATAKTSWGSPARELKADTLVDVGGQMAPLKVAEQMGLVRRDNTGKWIETTPSERQSAEPPPSEEAVMGEIKAEPFSQADEAALVEAVGDVSTQALGSVLIPHALDIAATGESNANYEEIASRVGITPERAAEIVETVEQLFQQQVDAELEKMQVDPQAFYEWARVHRLDHLNRAVVNHLAARSLSDYRTLAKEYLRKAVPDMEGLKNAGYEAKIDPTTKEPLVRLRGTWVSVRAAARDGLI